MINNGVQELRVDFPQGIRGGVYANNMMVGHTKEEFILDFIFVAPPVGLVTSRVIINPGHLKRIIAALSENLKKYESAFGNIQQAEDPHKGPIGFHS